MEDKALETIDTNLLSWRKFWRGHNSLTNHLLLHVPTDMDRVGMAVGEIRNDTEERQGGLECVGENSSQREAGDLDGEASETVE